ncbi:hypothetical protein B0J12DRAFT_738308 [Macrophomina phaseolina]|uniref:DUF6594 domain-containing protein n=1 Tax=Macrophomina phaseolina TaxID=35725 RepID=A0ABQ8GGJ3_9PEZI|nr:hypothetical protein B0J12DRAFT_738308 [Macrophomina phaseolina]
MDLAPLTPILNTLGPVSYGGDETSREFGEAEIKYTGKKFLRAAALVGTIVASILPVLAIVLYTVQDTPARLGLIAAFTAVFSTCLWFMTEGNLIEVFTATSTFAAVCVVFIGNDFR